MRIGHASSSLNSELMSLVLLRTAILMSHPGKHTSTLWSLLPTFRLNDENTVLRRDFLLWLYSTASITPHANHRVCSMVKGVVTRSTVDALSELFSPFLKGGNSAFSAIASGLLRKPNIGHSNNYGSNGPNRNKMGSNY